MNGAITDTSDAVVSSARVTVTSVDTGFQRETTSDTTGFYEVSLLQPGDYNISVQKEGFRQFTREGVRLEVNQVARVDFVLQLGAGCATSSCRRRLKLPIA
jgi:Carboxypeptidase regulatory-like domain